MEEYKCVVPMEASLSLSREVNQEVLFFLLSRTADIFGMSLFHRYSTFPVVSCEQKKLECKQCERECLIIMQARSQLFLFEYGLLSKVLYLSVKSRVI